MLARTLKLPANRSCLLLGARQTGKSTLVRGQLPASAWQVDLLDHDTHMRFAKDPAQFRREAEARIKAGTRIVFVDEIQKVPELLDQVQALIDRGKARFILTGSSARKLRRNGTNLLGGRAMVRTLHPLTIAEIGEAAELPRILRFGSLPVAALSSDEEARDFLIAYTETYLREEILAESLVRNLGGFARCLDIVAHQSGDMLNTAAIARDAGVATRTVTEYCQILQDTLVAKRLEAWRNSPRARMALHPKLYLFDLGVLNALCKRLTAEFAPETSGRLFEHFLVLETWRCIDYARSEANCFYWRTHVGTEVDLVIEKHGELVLAAEIKHRKTITGADLRGLRSFHAAHPETPRVVAACVPEPFDLEGVQVLPWPDFLQRVADLA